MNKTVRVGLVQHACTDDYRHNLAVSEQGIRQAAAAGAGLVLLPELHTGVYFCQLEDPAQFDLAQPVPGPATEYVAALARELGIVIVASVFERRAAGLSHNTAVVLAPDGSIAGCYRKMHIPDDPGFHEKFYFTPGDQGFVPIETSVGSLGVMVCWDQWYPEGARLMALAGAQILLYPTAIGWDPRDPVPERERQRDSWITIQRAHAIANGLPVAACNRIGREPDPEKRTEGISFWGSSFLAGPQGELLAQAPADGPAVTVADVDIGRTEVVRRIWPFLRDRRIDAYHDLVKRYTS